MGNSAIQVKNRYDRRRVIEVTSSESGRCCPRVVRRASRAFILGALVFFLGTLEAVLNFVEKMKRPPGKRPSRRLLLFLARVFSLFMLHWFFEPRALEGKGISAHRALCPLQSRSGSISKNTEESRI